MTMTLQDFFGYFQYCSATSDKLLSKSDDYGDVCEHVKKIMIVPDDRFQDILERLCPENCPNNSENIENNSQILLL